MTRTSEHTKLRIISLASKSKSINAIVRQLKEEDTRITHQTVAKVLKKYRESGTLADKTTPGRQPILTRQQMDFIDSKMEENDELTSIGKTYSQTTTQLHSYTANCSSVANSI